MKMKYTLIFLSLSLIPSAFAEKHKGISYKEITSDVYVVTDEDYHQSNVLVARMDKKTVLIASSPFETQNAEAMMKWIKTKFSPDKIIAINTHFHSDGTGGNDAYKKHDVEIWASDLTKKLHQEKDQYYQKKQAEDFKSQPELSKRILARKVILAANVFPINKGMERSFGENSFQVYYPGPAHTKDNVVVYLPKQKVMFGGCLIKPGQTLGYLGDADVEAYASSAENLKQFDVKFVIPGHGKDVGGVEFIDNTIRLAKEAKK